MPCARAMRPTSTMLVETRAHSRLTRPLAVANLERRVLPAVSSRAVAAPACAARPRSVPAGRSPCPMSPGATISSTSVVPRCCVSVTLHRVGRDRPARVADDLDDARTGLAHGVAPVAVGAARRVGGRLRAARQVTRQQRAHRVGRLRALARSSIDALAVDVDERRLACAGCSGRGSRRSCCRARRANR